jgi:hypothetical protein
VLQRAATCRVLLQRHQVDASITGQPLLTVLRNFVPLVKAPSQLERLEGRLVPPQRSNGY